MSSHGWRALAATCYSHRRRFALGALFGLFSLFAIPSGNPIWLTNLEFLGYLLFLIPLPQGP
ncbi:MAG TPA: hypothetical protein VKE94_03265 [Gemmataceae bacterium]|nr:hypothetical protein [Gemmataceae bacterium]